jgi:hypothetical protein
MEREIDMKEVSDGRFYGLRDMVKAGCDDCRGCCDCCRGMGTSIVLDPYDIYRLTAGLGVSFEQLLTDRVELNLAEGLILPNLKMGGEDESCGFLNEEGRCSIHPYRPGMCRIFPLGRYYENGSFQYFIQVHECPREPKTKVKVQKWIDTPDVKRNEAFITDWHYYLKGLSAQIQEAQDGNYQKNISLFILKQFYQTPYEQGRDFYEQFYERLDPVYRSSSS